MNPKPNSVMLIDDNPHDNFFHEREIKKAALEILVITKETGRAALDYLVTKNTTDFPTPDLIFLDINMPSMSGWEFLEEYKKLDKEIQEKAIIVMLTTGDNVEEVEKAKAYSFVSDYITKPLTKEIVKEIHKYFK